MSRVVKLEELCLPDQIGKYGIPAVAEEFSEDKVRYLRITDIDDYGNLLENDKKSVSSPEIEKYILKEGDIVFARTGNSTGRTYFHEEKNGELAFAGFLIKFSLDESKVNPKYLKYFTISKPYKQWVDNLSNGSTRGNINAKTFADCPIILPSREQQDYLVRVLSSLEDKIQINNQINQELEAMAKTLYDYWFVQFDFPDQNGKPYRSSGGKMVYNPELKREIPEGWGVAKLNEVVDLISGYPFSSNDYVISGKYKLYTIKNVQDGYTVDKVDNYLDFLPSNMSHECQLRRGDLIMSLTGNVGRVGMVYEDDVLLNQRVLKLNPINKTHKSFIYSFFRSDVTKAHLENMSTGTSQKNLSPIDIGNMMIPFPSESLLSKFLDNLNMLENNLVENQQLTQLRDWLLPMLMNGQVKVE